MSSFKNGVFDKIKNELLDICKKYSLKGDDLFKFLQYVFGKELLSLVEKELSESESGSDLSESESDLSESESEIESLSEKDNDIDIQNGKLKNV